MKNLQTFYINIFRSSKNSSEIIVYTSVLLRSWFSSFLVACDETYETKDTKLSFTVDYPTPQFYVVQISDKVFPSTFKLLYSVSYYFFIFLICVLKVSFDG